jgi:thiol-disulfide isomerase/thioredoxin
LLFFTSYFQAAPDTGLVDEIFLAQRKNFMRLKSINMTHSEDWQPSEYMKKNSDDPIYHEPRHFVFNFQKENKKFRIESALDGTKVSPEKENSLDRSITAFNSDKYQRFDKRSLWLAFMDREINPLEEMNFPLTRPYIYLFSGERLSFENIQSETIWNKLKQRVTITGNTTVEGHDCIKMEIIFPGKTYSSQVYWAKEFGYYPIKVQRFNLDGKKYVEIIVKEVTKRDTEEGPIFVPMIMEQTQWDGTTGYKRLVLKYTIDGNSLSVNEDIPDENFTIPLYMAKKITDYTNSWNNYDPKNAPAYSMKGKASPEFTLAKLGGGNMTLSREKAKIVVLDFWATWCGSCIAALPGFERVQKWAIENDHPVALYCINVKEEPAKVENFCKKNEVSIPVLIDKEGIVCKKYNVPGFPTTIIIANGMIKHVHIGGGGDKKMLLRQEKQLKEEIKALLAELGEK